MFSYYNIGFHCRFTAAVLRGIYQGFATLFALRVQITPGFNAILVRRAINMGGKCGLVITQTAIYICTRMLGKVGAPGLWCSAGISQVLGSLDGRGIILRIGLVITRTHFSNSAFGLRRPSSWGRRAAPRPAWSDQHGLAESGVCDGYHHHVL